MEFQGALFAVRSMAVSRSFYETVLGRKVALDFGANLVFEGGPTLQEGFSALAGFPEERTVYRAHNAELYFESQDFDGDAARVKAAGVELLHEVREYPWGQRVLRFYDPDGHIIELGEAMSTVVLRFLDHAWFAEPRSAEDIPWNLSGSARHCVKPDGMRFCRRTAKDAPWRRNFRGAPFGFLWTVRRGTTVCIRSNSA